MNGPIRIDDCEASAALKAAKANQAREPGSQLKAKEAHDAIRATLDYEADVATMGVFEFIACSGHSHRIAVDNCANPAGTDSNSRSAKAS